MKPHWRLFDSDVKHRIESLLSTTYCSKSWTDINIDFENRTINHCCKADKHSFPDVLTEKFISLNDAIVERRNQSMQNQAHSDCIGCWNNTLTGSSSYRDWANVWTDTEFAERKDVLTGPTSDVYTHYIEIRTDRICDMACIYCNAYSSSKIAQEEGVPYKDSTNENDYKVFKQWIKSFMHRTDIVEQNAKITFIFLGGEPTASERFYELIDFIEEQAAFTDKIIRLEICTNANSKRFLMDKLVDRMNTSKLVWAIGISNEAFGESAELVRDGLVWDRFTDNFVKYVKHENVETIVLNPTLCVFSIKSFHEYISWAYEQIRTYAPTKEFLWYGNFVSLPYELDIAYLPESYKKYIDLAIDVATSETDLNQINKQVFIDYLHTIKNRIGTSYSSEYKKSAEEFLLKKQIVKKTDKLIKLMDNLDL